VVPGESSIGHFKLGVETLPKRGSGGARLAIIGEPFSEPDELIAAGNALGSRVVARSSTSLESSGEWSGAFTSYLDLAPSDLPKAVVGCWASAFSVASLDRQYAAGIEPGSFTMPVLIQPSLDPRAGGVAELRSDGSVVVQGVEGSPAPLLQGWISGFEASKRGAVGQWVGSELIKLAGVAALEDIAEVLRKANDLSGANRCEWAIDGGLWILQLDSVTRVAQSIAPSRQPKVVDPVLVQFARVVMRCPGVLGDESVLPWALAGLPRGGEQVDVVPEEALGEVRRLSSELTATAWGMPFREASETARQCLEGLRGPDPSAAIDRIRRLRSPDRNDAIVALGLIDTLRVAMVRLGAAADLESAWRLSLDQIESVLQGRSIDRVPRLGLGRWDPLVASIVLDMGSRQVGTPAAAGIGVGVGARISDAGGMTSFKSRSVITAPLAVPNLAPLLWDAAGLVTEGGSPAAHLFESARSLGLPSVCGVPIPEDDLIVAVDGHTGTVSTIALYPDPT
jgi:hypothetical protein